MSRDKNKTKDKILQGAISLLTRSGFRDFGINSVAKEVGHDKVLIYRYFGDINGLLNAVAGKIEFFPEVDLFRETWNPKEKDKASTLAAYLHGYIHEIFNRPLTLQILNWETVEENPLVINCKIARDHFEETLLHDLYPEDKNLHSVISSLFSFILPGILHQYRGNKSIEGKEIDEYIMPLCRRLFPDNEDRMINREDKIRVAFENEDNDPNSLPTELL